MEKPLPAHKPGPSAERVQSIFREVAHGYDRANDWMTFGMVRVWRKKLVRWSGVAPGDHVLDCATGTGDLAIVFKRAVGKGGTVVGTDFCEEMLELAPNKAQDHDLEITFSHADTLNLPFADNTFDVVGIAYGVRNVEDPQRAVSEMARVCRHGGRVMILETGDNHRGPAAPFHWCFTQFALPLIGRLATGVRAPYEYLRDSSRSFPSRDDFVRIMREAHPFAEVEYRSLLSGSSFLYRGRVHKGGQGR